MKKLIGLTVALFLGSSQLLWATQMSFKYQSFDGEQIVPCNYKLINEMAQDWQVICEKDTFKRQYTVHLWITEFPKQNEPKLSAEVLYWVTEVGGPAPHKSNGSTIWFHLKDNTRMQGITVSQSVENDSAGLYLDFRPTL